MFPPSVRSTRTLIRSGLFWILLGLSSSWSAAAAEAGSAGTTEAGLKIAQESIAQAFQEGNADRLAALFSRRIKTYVAWSPLAADDGYYGADQIRLLLRRLFRGCETVRFRLLEPVSQARPDGVAVVPAAWVFRRDGSTPTEVRISLRLGPESGAWRVREIRDLK